MKKSTVLIAEDDLVIIDGCFRPLLELSYDIVAAVGDGLGAVEAAEQHWPDVVLMDIALPHSGGFQAARRILERQPDCKMLFVSNYADEAYVEAASEMHASGYVLKNRANSELVFAIETVLQGRFYRSAF